MGAQRGKACNLSWGSGRLGNIFSMFLLLRDVALLKP